VLQEPIPAAFGLEGRFANILNTRALDRFVNARKDNCFRLHATAALLGLFQFFFLFLLTIVGIAPGFCRGFLFRSIRFVCVAIIFG
jgi:hypothetical protein